MYVYIYIFTLAHLSATSTSCLQLAPCSLCLTTHARFWQSKNGKAGTLSPNFAPHTVTGVYKVPQRLRQHMLNHST